MVTSPLLEAPRMSAYWSVGHIVQEAAIARAQHDIAKQNAEAQRHQAQVDGLRARDGHHAGVHCRWQSLMKIRCEMRRRTSMNHYAHVGKVYKMHEWLEYRCIDSEPEKWWRQRANSWQLREQIEPAFHRAARVNEWPLACSRRAAYHRCSTGVKMGPDHALCRTVRATS